MVSVVDKAASLAFALFVLVEWTFNESHDDEKYSARVGWLLAATISVIVAYQFEPSRDEVEGQSTAPALNAVRQDATIAPPKEITSVQDVLETSVQSLVAAVEESVLGTPPPSAVSATSLDNSILSEAASSTTGTKKRKGILRKTASALLSPLRRSRSGKTSGFSNPATPPTEVSVLSQDNPASSPALSASALSPATSSLLEDSSLQEVIAERPDDAQRQVVVLSNTELQLDKFGFGPVAPPPPSDYVYINPNTWGYAGHLDEKQQKSLEEMRAKNFSCIESQQVPPAFLINDETLLRFLRARKFDIDKAARMFEAHLAWRDKFLPSKLSPNDIATVLGTGLARFGPYSKTGLPSTLIKVEYFEPAKFEGDVDLFTRYVAFFFERAVKNLPNGADKGILFFDMKGWSLRKHATRFSLRLVAELINIIQAHNPERLEKCILFNTPLIFSGTWTIIKGLLDPVVAGKVMFVSDTKVMLEFFDKEHLPVEYGGERSLPYPIEGFAELHTAA